MVLLFLFYTDLDGKLNAWSVLDEFAVDFSCSFSSSWFVLVAVLGRFGWTVQVRQVKWIRWIRWNEGGSGFFLVVLSLL